MTESASDEMLSRCRIRLRELAPFFSAMTLFARYRADEQVDAMQTDGELIRFNPAFMLSLPHEEQAILLLHVTLHTALLHPLRMRWRQPDLWQIACDVMVNHIIETQTKFKAPSGTVCLRHLGAKFEPKTAEQVYEWLLKHTVVVEIVWRVVIQGISLPGTAAGSVQVNPGQLRKAGLAAALAARFAGSSAEGTNNAAGNPGNLGNAGNKSDTSPIKATKPIRDLLPMAEAREQAIRAHWEAALINIRQSLERQKAVGKEAAGLLREFEAALSPQLDWRTLLRRFVARTQSDFSSYDRRFISQGLYLEMLESETVNIKVAVDTSGSMTDEDLQQIASELAGILGVYPDIACSLYFCDTELDGPYTVSSQLALPDAVGGGGTDFRPFFSMLDEERSGTGTIHGAVYFTDGFGEFPEQAPAYPVLWVALPGAAENEEFPFGEVVRMA